MNTFSALLAKDVMSSPIWSTSPEFSVDRLEQDFVRHGVRAMPVVQHTKIVGIISRSDLMLLPVLSAAIESGVTVTIVDSNSTGSGDVAQRRATTLAIAERVRQRRPATAVLKQPAEVRAAARWN